MRSALSMRFGRLAAIAVSLLLLITVSVPAALGQDQLAVPTTPGQSVSVTWQGTILPGANTSSECGQLTDVGASSHVVTLSVPDGLYDTVTVTAVATITYSGPTDVIVTMIDAGGETQSGDNGFVDTDESASLTNPVAGDLTVIACMFDGALPQAYTGSLTLTAAAGPPPPAASCRPPGKPLTFTPPSYVDMHRAGGEPSVQSLADGTLLYAAHAGMYASWNALEDLVGREEEAQWSLERLKAEGDRSPADVLLTGAAGNLWNAARAGLLRPVTSATLNRNLKSYLLAVVGAEYLLRLLPRGTHDYAKFVKPSELAKMCRDADLSVASLTGMTYNPFTKIYALGRDTDVNYILHAQKA